MSSMDFQSRAPRLSFFDTSRPGEEDATCQTQFNPTEWEEELNAEYAHLQPIGMPHQVLQYTGTSNHRVSFDLFWLVQDPETREQCAKARRFLEAMFYPSGQAKSVATGSPPDILVVCPTILSMSVKFLTLRRKNSLFNKRGEVVQWNASLTCEENRRKRLTREEVLKYGTLRSPG